MFTITVEPRPKAEDGYVAVLRVDTRWGKKSFYGFAKTKLGAVEAVLADVRNTKRPHRLGRKPKKYKVAQSLVWF